MESLLELKDLVKKLFSINYFLFYFFLFLSFEMVFQCVLGCVYPISSSTDRKASQSEVLKTTHDENW